MHILHDNTLTTENCDKFSYVAGRYGQLVKFYNVEQLFADKIEYIKKMFPQASETRFSIGMFYRFFIPYLLAADIDKAIYLDSDTIVNLDIKELWQVELGDKPLAAADEVRADPFDHPSNAASNYLVTNGFVDYNDYFNSGVLLINIKILRKENEHLMDGVKFVGEHPQLIYLDQEVLNYLFSKNYLKLDEKFNAFVRKARRLNENLCYRRIYHFTGAGFGMDMRDLFNRLWMKYFAQTPWFDEETIGRLYASVQQLHVGFKQSMVNLTALMSGKTRAFFVAPDNIDGFKNFFAVRADEEIITVDSQESLNKLLDAMKRARGKKVFFIMLPNFPFQILTQAGFTPGKDFVNGLEFLSEAQGVPLNSYPLIQAM